MLLAIDVGNTNIVLGVFDGARLAESWRLATMRERAEELGGQFTLAAAVGRGTEVEAIVPNVSKA